MEITTEMIKELQKGDPSVEGAKAIEVVTNVDMTRYFRGIDLVMDLNMSAQPGKGETVQGVLSNANAAAEKIFPTDEYGPILVLTPEKAQLLKKRYGPEIGNMIRGYKEGLEVLKGVVKIDSDQRRQEMMNTYFDVKAELFGVDTQRVSFSV